MTLEEIESPNKQLEDRTANTVEKIEKFVSAK